MNYNCDPAHQVSILNKFVTLLFDVKHSLLTPQYDVRHPTTQRSLGISQLHDSNKKILSFSTYFLY